jgi:hypothetical protein
MNGYAEPANPCGDEIRQITLRLLAAQRDLIWADEDSRRDAIANAIETAVMICEMTNDVEEE